MATFDEATKVITGLQLYQAGIIDKNTMQQEMDGLDNIVAINERITKEKAEKVMFESLLAQASNGDPKAAMALVDIYNSPNNIGTILKKFYTAEEPEPSQEEAMMAQMMGGQGGPPMPPMPGGPPQQGGPPPSPGEVMQLLGGG